MIGRVNHIAIAVPDVAVAAAQWASMLGAECSAAEDLPEHGVRIVFVTAPNTKVELMQPIGEASPISAFLARNPDGWMHHICYDVDDIIAARDKLIGEGARVLGDGQPKTGAHGNPVLFLHPKDFCGTLIELEQVGE
jgi:methylmalonyl-CoA/ethylmalonyl-CoA epimerase